MGIYEPEKWNKTLTEKQYCELGEIAVNEIKMLSESDKWKQINLEHDNSDEEDDDFGDDDDNGNVTVSALLTQIIFTRISFLFYRCKSNLNVSQRVYMVRTIMNVISFLYVILVLLIDDIFLECTRKICSTSI